MPLSIELRTLSSLFSFDVRNEGGVACLYARLDEDDFEAAAFAVAYGIAHRRIGHNDRLFQAWLAAAQAEADEADPSKRDVELLIAGLLQNVGVPESPVTTAHLHGLVAEELWLEVISQHDLGLGIPIRVEGHDWSVTDPGGDGLTVHSVPDEHYCFRLWESKYHGSTGNQVKATVNRACRQLQSRAPSYLARFSMIAQRLTDDPGLATFYARLGEMWADNDTAAGASVVIGASTDAVEDNCFVEVPRFFALGPEQHQGQLNAVHDFDAFAQRVRAILWRGCGWTER